MSQPTNKMSAIEQRAKALADARATMSDIVTALNDRIEALHRQHMRGLKAAVHAVAEQHDKLKALIEEHPALFTKPKTVVMHGLKVGFKKGPGKVEFDDADKVVKLIEKHFPEQVELLAPSERKVSKDALQLMNAVDLKKLGVKVTGTGDAVLIAPVDSQVDKLLKALLKAATDETEAG